MRATRLAVFSFSAIILVLLVSKDLSPVLESRSVDLQHSSRPSSSQFDATTMTPGRMSVSPAELSIAARQKLLPLDTKSLLKIPRQLRHGEYVWNDQGVAPGSIAIWVDLRRQMISAFRNGSEIGTAVIVYGAQDMSSPEGVFKIQRKSSDYHSRTYDAPMPYSLFITNDGVALHGSPISKRRASHGCIGLPVEFAEKLFVAAKTGDVVTIVKSAP